MCRIENRIQKCTFTNFETFTIIAFAGERIGLVGHHDHLKVIHLLEYIRQTKNMASKQV